MQSIWSQRNLGRTPAVTVEELYEQVEAFAEGLVSNPVVPDVLIAEGEALSSKLVPLVEAVSSEPSMLQAQNFTLEALALGMIVGVCDGTLIYLGQKRREPSKLHFKDTKLQSNARTLTKNLNQILKTADEQWRKSHPDDLHLLCGYGKQENLNSLQEGSKVAGDCKEDLYPYRKFLLATFKGGYAMGAIQAAVAARG